MRYYHLRILVQPHDCAPQHHSIVISEDPLDWEARNFGRPYVTVTVLTEREITEAQYMTHRQRNSYASGIWYYLLSPEDCGEKTPFRIAS